MKSATWAYSTCCVSMFASLLWIYANPNRCMNGCINKKSKGAIWFDDHSKSKFYPLLAPVTFYNPHCHSRVLWMWWIPPKGSHLCPRTPVMTYFWWNLTLLHKSSWAQRVLEMQDLNFVCAFLLHHGYRTCWTCLFEDMTAAFPGWFIDLSLYSEYV